MSKIEEFEEVLETSNENKRNFYYLMPSIMIGFLLFMLVYPVAEEQIETQTGIQQDLNRKIQNNNIALLQKRIKLNDEKILKIKESIVNETENIEEIKNKLKELEFVFFDDLGFANNVEKIFKTSRDLNLTLHYLKTYDPKQKKDKNNKSLIKLIKHIEIDGFGGFVQIVRFIEFIESINTLHDFENITIQLKLQEKEKEKIKSKADDIYQNKDDRNVTEKVKIYFNFKILQYGVEL